jgi:hypothetical protein
MSVKKCNYESSELCHQKYNRHGILRTYYFYYVDEFYYYDYWVFFEYLKFFIVNNMTLA